MSIALQSDVIASRRDHYQLMRVARSRAHHSLQRYRHALEQKQLRQRLYKNRTNGDVVKTIVLTTNCLPFAIN